MRLYNPEFMKLIADAGATKINWAIILGNEVYYFKTSGYNPNIADSNYLRQLLISGFPSQFEPTQISKITYFGAGCGSEFGKERVKNALHIFFIQASKIDITTDLEGAAKGIFGNKSGVIGILGTGANAGYYNGVIISKSPPSLGYLLGDEGSGAYLGRKLLAKIIRNELPKNVIDDFYTKYNTTNSQIINSIYSNPKPNQYLGSFMPFLFDHIENEVCIALLDKAFSKFVSKFITPISDGVNFVEINMVGGVANAFQSRLKVVLNSQGYQLKVFNSPIEALIKRELF